MSLRTAIPTLLVAPLLALVPPSAPAQQPGSEAHRLQVTRPELEATLDRLRTLARSGSQSQWAAAETTYIRTRLDDGDFRAGDRVLLSVEDVVLASSADRPAPAAKTPEQELSDTFTVRDDQDVLLPVVGRVSLRGVLRSELEPVLTRAVAAYIKDPVVHARALVSVGVTGEVLRPGFYGMAPDAVLSAVLTAAGGPTKDAKMSKLKLERDGKGLISGGDLRRAIEQGRTLDELQVRSGDQLVVPTQHHGDLYGPLRFIAVLLSVPVTIYTLTHLH